MSWSPPRSDEVEVELNQADLRIDVFRSSGPGGQSVNTTDSAVRITHLPTGIVVSCQNEKSQLQNKEQAMRILRARLHAIAKEEAEASAAAARRSQVRTVDRSERIRTYNYPENRISDHRTGFKAYKLDQVLEGDLDDVVQSAIDADEAAQLAAVATDRDRWADQPDRPDARRRGSRADGAEPAVAAATAAPAPGCRARAPTPSCSPRTCSGSPRSEVARLALVGGTRRRTGTTTWSPSGRAGSRCST